MTPRVPAKALVHGTSIRVLSRATRGRLEQRRESAGVNAREIALRASEREAEHQLMLDTPVRLVQQRDARLKILARRSICGGGLDLSHSR